MSTDIVKYDVEHPWTRQPFDHEKAWSAFVVFRDSVSPRSLLTVAKATGNSIAELKDWSINFGWNERVNVYDRWLDIRRSEQVSALINEDALERATRHIAHLRQVQSLIEASLNDWIRQSVLTGRSVIEKPKDAMIMLKQCIELERMIAGEASNSSGLEESELDLGKLSIDQLDTLRELISIAKKKD